MGPFLLLLLIFFVIIPLFRGAVAVYRARRAARKFFDQFRRPAGSAGSREPQQPKAKPKKINPEDGEFVSFEDLPADEASHDTTVEYQSVTIEQQIIDVEWEDIKS